MIPSPLPNVLLHRHCIFLVWDSFDVFMSHCLTTLGGEGGGGDAEEPEEEWLMQADWLRWGSLRCYFWIRHQFCLKSLGHGERGREELCVSVRSRDVPPKSSATALRSAWMNSQCWNPVWHLSVKTKSKVCHGMFSWSRREKLTSALKTNRRRDCWPHNSFELVPKLVSASVSGWELVLLFSPHAVLWSSFLTN